MINFYRMSDKDMILLSAAIAVILIEGLTLDEQNTLGNFIMCVGQDIVSASSQQALLLSRAERLADNNTRAQ